MSFLCRKAVTLGGKRYEAGNEIPEEAVLSSRKRALIANGYIAEMNVEQKAVAPDGATLFTQEELEAKVAEAVSEIKKELEEAQQYVAELKETDPGAYDGVVIVSIGTAGEGENEQAMALPLKPEELQQAFAIMQLNAEDGAKEIANVVSENVLILLHAVDSRSTIKKAAKTQADTLSTINGNLDGAGAGNAPTDPK